MPVTCRSIILAGHTGAHAPIIAGLGHPNPRFRVVALNSALRIKFLDKSNILKYLDDQAAEVRYRTVELLARNPDLISIAAIERLLVLLEEEPTAELVAFALGEISLDQLNSEEPAGRSGELKSTIAAALAEVASNSKDSLCREAAIASLGCIGEELAVILDALEDTATVRRRAVVSLAAFEGPEVDQALSSATSDRDWQVRQIAEDLLSITQEDHDSSVGQPE